MGKGKRARERMQRFQAERKIKQKERKAAFRAARAAEKAAENAGTEGVTGEMNAAPTDNAEEPLNADASNDDVEMPDDNGIEDNKKPVKVPGPFHARDVVFQPILRLDNKTDEYCVTYFKKTLSRATSRQFLTSYGNRLDPKLWPIKYIRELGNILRFTGKNSNDSGRLLAFFTTVMEEAVEVKAKNPQWFPQTTEQLMIFDDLVEFMREMYKRLYGKRIKAGGMTHLGRMEAFLLYETMQYMLVDRQGFLNDNNAKLDLAVGGELRDLTKKQQALMDAMEAWKASWPGDKFLLSDFLVTAIDPTELEVLNVSLRPREGAEKDEGDEAIAEEADEHGDFEDEDTHDEEEEEPRPSFTNLSMRPRKPADE
ncbi:hypothetical protein F5X68DRAFT_273992 [Plectosphaerella plurivora]|uniref:Uncharacterized protein n=1 Tax=Plectosphaerella plurivora TaxID=936078 RepID=A0A9P9AEB6_9PEZI|nr:hypothetical protein F5X68DRAFT_273992 [Plectosphaerella plurivora]